MHWTSNWQRPSFNSNIVKSKEAEEVRMNKVKKCATQGFEAHKYFRTQKDYIMKLLKVHRYLGFMDYGMIQKQNDQEPKYQLKMKTFL